MITLDRIVNEYRRRTGSAYDGSESAVVGSGLNGSLEQKCSAFRDELLTQTVLGQIERFLALFSSDERAAGLLESIIGTPPDIFWRVFMKWSPTCTGAGEYRRDLLYVLRANSRLCPCREFMDRAEFYQSLSFPLTVYRGCGRMQVRGIVWTTDFQWAVYYAPLRRDTYQSAA
jgi:hypothetical protein